MTGATPKPRAYLDHNATAPLSLVARDAMAAAMDVVGNPSSVHREGRAARALVEEARRNVAALAGAPAGGVIFTASGTEAANLGLNPLAGAGPNDEPFARLIVSAGEHACVLKGHRFAGDRVEIAPLRGDGRIDLDWLAARCERESGRVLVALQGANNETGVLQPVAEAAAIVHARGGRVLCDAVQLAGRTPLDIAALGADFLVLSAHKMGGPKGVGALIAARVDLNPGTPLIRGGGQERGQRAGTENVPAIAGFGAIARDANGQAEREGPRLADLRDRLTAAVRESAPGAIVFGEAAPRLPNTVCFAAPGVSAATLMIALDLEGVAASSGAACSSGKVAPSHVLAAMGVSTEHAAGAIRLSLGWSSSAADVEIFASAFASAMKRLRKVRGAA